MAISPKYTLDTNLFIDGMRDKAQCEALTEFHLRHGPKEYLCSVVALELRMGCRTPEALNTVLEKTINRFAKPGRMITPSWSAWNSAGDTLAQLAKRDGMLVGEMPRSFVNDVLIAHCCREEGVTLVTRNAKDFERIGKVVKFGWVAGWVR